MEVARGLAVDPLLLAAVARVAVGSPDGPRWIATKPFHWGHRDRGRRRRPASGSRGAGSRRPRAAATPRTRPSGCPPAASSAGISSTPDTGAPTNRARRVQRPGRQPAPRAVPEAGVDRVLGGVAAARRPRPLADRRVLGGRREVRIPRRRWVGLTVTAATAAAGSRAPPGTVISVAHDRKVPQTRPSSKAAQVRSGSHSAVTASAIFATSGRSRNPVERASM
jgi:hypothetical protein